MEKLKMMAKKVFEPKVKIAKVEAKVKMMPKPSLKPKMAMKTKIAVTKKPLMK